MGLFTIGASLLGGLLGSKGKKAEETSQRKTDPRVDPYLFGANGQPGLLQMSYDKLVDQMRPGSLQGYDDMQRVGLGLLSAPVAGNGFGLFRLGGLGGLGGSRQGVAEGMATRGDMDSLQGNLANLFGQDRVLQARGPDTNLYGQQLGGVDVGWF